MNQAILTLYSTPFGEYRLNTLGRLAGIFAQLVRPLSGIRGAGRVCRLVNRGFLKAGVPPIQVARMHDGTRMRLDLRSQTEWFAFYSGRYDEVALGLIRKLLSRFDGDFLDIGGNIGMYCVRLAVGFESGRRCLCFEPMPANAHRIRENTQLNSVDDRVDVYQIALSDTDGETDLVLREDFEMGSATGNASIAISDDADGQFRKIRVLMRRFDSLLAERGEARIPVVKVDIEGHEDFFLRGASSWLYKERPIILAEINNWFYEKRGTTSSAVSLRHRFRKITRLPFCETAALLAFSSDSRLKHSPDFVR
jgi:FkbM family methyltransferase